MTLGSSCIVAQGSEAGGHAVLSIASAPAASAARASASVVAQANQAMPRALQPSR
jgi:NAD(P)H-dependent flavin oxidoreductase YrpB (nitropropane dioxygenase family)